MLFAAVQYLATLIRAMQMGDLWTEYDSDLCPFLGAFSFRACHVYRVAGRAVHADASCCQARPPCQPRQARSATSRARGKGPAPGCSQPPRPRPSPPSLPTPSQCPPCALVSRTRPSTLPSLQTPPACYSVASCPHRSATGLRARVRLREGPPQVLVPRAFLA